MEINKIEPLFKVKRPVIGVVYLKGDNSIDTLQGAKKEIDIYLSGDVDALIMENYLGSLNDAKEILQYLRNIKAKIIYGVNLRRSFFINHKHMPSYEASFALAQEYGASFIQIDIVNDYLSTINNMSDDLKLVHDLKELRSKSQVLVLGDMRLKYQPILSNKTEEAELSIGRDCCDVIVATGNAIENESKINKLKRFRDVFGKVPLFVETSMTADTFEEQLSIADGCIVGNYHDDEVSAEHVKLFMNKVKTARKNI